MIYLSRFLAPFVIQFEFIDLKIMFSCTIKLLWADNIFFCRKYIIFIIGRQKGTELWKMCTDFLDFSFFFSFWNFGISRLIIVTYWSLISDSARIVFTPGNHWSGRFPPLDRNKALWGSFLVVGSKGKVIHPKYYKNVINLVLLLSFFDRLGHQGSTEDFCKFCY